MAEWLPPASLLAAALVACLLGMTWLALAMPVHARQAWPVLPAAPAAGMLRVLGGGALLLALGLCLRIDHATMAVLVWLMGVALAATGVALALAWKPQYLALLAPWVRSAKARRSD